MKTITDTDTDMVPEEIQLFSKELVDSFKKSVIKKLLHLKQKVEKHKIGIANKLP